MTTNLAIAHWRRHRRSTGAAPDGSAPEHLVERLDLVRALRRLPERQREVLALRYLADLTEAQTADRLGCSVGPVKQHASRARRSMRQLLDDGESRPAVIATSDHRANGAEPC